MPEGYTGTLIDYLGERREVAWAVLDRNDLATGLPVPDEADLKAYHAEHEDRFTLPERKRITYAWLTPDMLIDTVEVDEQALREAYEAREDEFNRPARRLVERLAFSDRAGAGGARPDQGRRDGFEDLVAERGLELAISTSATSPAPIWRAAEEVFALDTGEVIGPLPSPVGPALFRVNAILSAQSPPSRRRARSCARRWPATAPAAPSTPEIEEVEDKLAGGATLEDLAAETEMELGDDRLAPDMREGIAAYPAFRRPAAEVDGMTTPAAQFADGGLFALRLDEVVPPRCSRSTRCAPGSRRPGPPTTLVTQLTDQVQAALSKLRSGAGLAEAGLRVDGQQTITRRGFRADVPPDFIETVFDLEPGGAT